ncbi:putative 3-ketodihydrosphingosine protein [Thozetella sp. PMI_491]|nr:putative 3-ketodihydrosphingosine protein [Thozetella sp. PMI_491]
MDSFNSLFASPLVVLTAIGVLSTVVAVVAMGLFSKNQMPVEGRTVLLTGASEGMGRSAAIQLAAKGANIIIVSRNVQRLQEALGDVQAAAKSPAQRFHYIQADVAEHNYAARVVAEAIAWNNGRSPDIVWCVAGMSTPLLWADERTLPATRRNMDVNFFGAAEMSHAILTEWLAPENSTSPSAEPKHLIFTASVLAFFAVAGYGPYNPTKWALRGLIDTLAMELHLYPNNPVRVHMVAPSNIESPGMQRENKTKPDITMELEKDEAPVSADEVAKLSIAGLEAGNYFVPVGFTSNLLRTAVLGGSPRNNWILDTILGWLMPFIFLFVVSDMNGKISKWAKQHGHPSGYKKKE